ncbi:hypothetical protein TUM4433_31240 [Shewanella schlegeliana]|nr:hypothetical protein TUM4433_31240 [Shewanella schlegeliana]
MRREPIEEGEFLSAMLTLEYEALAIFKIAEGNKSSSTLRIYPYQIMSGEQALSPLAQLLTK